MTSTFKNLAQAVVEAAADKKGFDIVSLDLRNVSLMADYFILVTGKTDRQVGAIVEGIKDRLGEMGQKPERLEGEKGSHWILLDYGGVVVHVFHQEAREYYQLERLWADAPQLQLPAGGQAK